MSRPGTWQPGQSGNPKGRPKTRVLSERLRAAGSHTVIVDGKPVAGSLYAARLAWDGLTTGRLRFPEDTEDTVLSFDQWLTLMRFVYGQVDGPPTQALEVSGDAGGPVVLRVVYDAAPGTSTDEP